MAATVDALEWEVDGLRLAGLAWGPQAGVPVLALHGWMDHAGSFAELGPRLDGCRVVAPDLSGQGLSGHRAAHASYNIWDDLPQIAGLLDRLGWADCVLLGHSRGANIATLFAAAQPARVRALVALEALVPEPVDEAEVVATLAAFVAERRGREGARTGRVFASREAYVARRVARGNSRAVAEALAPRALEDGPGGARLRGDPRLFSSSAVKLGRAQLAAVLDALRCPVLNVWADAGIGRARPVIAGLVEMAEERVARYARMEIPGDHHFHLEPDAAGRIAAAVGAFLGREGALGPPVRPEARR